MENGKLYSAAFELQEFIEKQCWDFAFIGGLALLRWGEIRFTQDVDATLLTRFTDESDYIDAILRAFRSRYPNTKEFALANRVLLLFASNDIGIDISLAGFDYEEIMIERSSYFQYAKNIALRTCSAEDLIILKAFADRDKDWHDVDTILVRQKGKLDLDYVLETLAPLCELKEDEKIMPRLEKLIS